MINEIILRQFMGMTLFDTIVVCLSKHSHGSLLRIANIVPICGCLVIISLQTGLDINFIADNSIESTNAINWVWMSAHIILVLCILITLWWQTRNTDDNDNIDHGCGDNEDFEALSLIILSIIAWIMLCTDEMDEEEGTNSIWRIFTILVTIFIQMIALFEWRKNQNKISEMPILIGFICAFNLCDFSYALIFETYHFYKLGANDKLTLLFQLSYTFSFAISHIILWTLWQYIEWYEDDNKDNKDNQDDLPIIPKDSLSKPKPINEKSGLLAMPTVENNAVAGNGKENVELEEA